MINIMHAPVNKPVKAGAAAFEDRQAAIDWLKSSDGFASAPVKSVVPVRGGAGFFPWVLTDVLG